jgi:hypothetical protein
MSTYGFSIGEYVVQRRGFQVWFYFTCRSKHGGIHLNQAIRHLEATPNPGI